MDIFCKSWRYIQKTFFRSLYNVAICDSKRGMILLTKISNTIISKQNIFIVKKELHLFYLQAFIFFGSRDKIVLWFEVNKKQKHHLKEKLKKVFEKTKKKFKQKYEKTPQKEMPQTWSVSSKKKKWSQTRSIAKKKKKTKRP